MPNGKPLYIEHPEDFMSWCLMRISETGQHEEALAQFYASYILAMENHEDQLPEFLGAMENLYKRIYHLIGHPDRVWPGLMPGPPLPLHDVWTKAIEDIGQNEIDDLEARVNEVREQESFDVTWYAYDQENKEVAVLTERRGGEIDIIEFAPELLDRHFQVHWIMDPIHANHASIRLGGHHWLMKQKQAKQIVGLNELADSHLDLDSDGQILHAILGNMKDAAEDFDKRGSLRDF